MRIRFLSDQVYETEAPGKGPSFSAGMVLDQADVGATLGRKVSEEWTAAFLERWLRRGVAVVEAEAPQPVRRKR